MMFDMPMLVGENAVVIPAGYVTRRRILLKPESAHAELQLINAPDGVWLQGDMLIVSSQVERSCFFGVQAKKGGDSAELKIELRKDPQLRDVPPAPLDKNGWRLYYHDEFDGETLDPEFWCGYYLRGWTTDAQAQAQYEVRDGYLALGCWEDRGPWCDQDGQHRVSSVQTFERKHLHRFGRVTGARDIGDFDGLCTKYGYYEIRARFPDTGDGSHFAWWMIGVQDDQHDSAELGGEAYPVGRYSNQTAEYDIIEQTLDNRSKDFDMNAWRPVIHPNGSKDLTYLWVPETHIHKSASGEFHRYGFEWDEMGTKFYLDGVLVQETDRSPTYRMMTLFSVYGGCRSFACGMGPDRGIYPKESLIDYFRIYKRDERARPCSVAWERYGMPENIRIPDEEKTECALKAVLLDQFDHPIEGRLRWRLSTDVSGRDPLSKEEMQRNGVTIDAETGAITVMPWAERMDLFVTAYYSDTILTVKHMKLSDDSPRPVHFSFEKKKYVLHPAQPVRLEAKLFDQYGAVIHAQVHYQVSWDLTGRAMRMDTPLIFGGDGLLYAGDAPRAGKYVVTAHSFFGVCASIVEIIES